jgi:two-component system, NarL family, invasion response regulator UvrY
VVDDQAGFRRAAAAALDDLDGFVLAGECETGELAVERVGRVGREMVLMDIHMPGIGGIEATRLIRAAHPEVVVVLMSTYDVDDLSADAVSCGAAAYLHKERLSPDLLSRIWLTGG